MSDEPRDESVLGAEEPDTQENTELTPEQIAEEAKAEEEFISSPEDTVENPLVPEAPKEEDDDSVTRLEGAIGSGNLETDYPEEKQLVSNEGNAMNDNPSEPVEAPVEEPVLVSGAAEASNAETSILNKAAQPDAADGAAPKKKSKKGLIIGIIIALLVLIGGGVAFFILMLVRESPEASLKDALANFWKAENVQISGEFTGSGDSNGGFAAGLNNVKFDAKKSGSNMTGSGSFEVELAGQKIDLGFSASYIKGGEFYFKIDGLKELSKNLDLSGLSSLLGSTGDIDMGEMISEMLDTVAKKLDGNWYKITAKDLNKVSKNSSYSMNCLLNSADGALSPDTMQKIADIYKEHPFIEIDKDGEVKEEDGIKYYPVKINKEEEKAFKEEAKKIEELKKIAGCSADTYGEDGTPNKMSQETPRTDCYPMNDDDTDCATKIGGDEEQKTKKEDDDEYTYRIGIRPWSHELAGIKSTSKDGNGVSFKLKYENQEVSAPEDSKSFEKLVEDFTEATSTAFKSFAKKYAESYCKELYGSYGDSLVKTCMQQMETAMNEYLKKNMNFTDMFSGIGGGETISL